MISKIYDLHGVKVNVVKKQYGNGRLAVVLVCEGGEPYSTASTNLSDELEVGENEFFCKCWSENDGIDQWLIDNGIAEKVGEVFGEAGYTQSPLMRLLIQ